MAQPTGAFDTFRAIGEREDLQDVIYNISPTETPFMSNIGQSSAKAVFHEWQTDSLATASNSNAQIEGDDVTGSTASATTRIGNYTQISRKDVVISGTLEAVDKAGRDSELAYQIAKLGKELKRDMESSLSQDNAAVAGGSGTARVLASLEAWLTTNKTHLGTTGTTPGVNSNSTVLTAPTDGTQGALSEALLKSVIQSAWTSGGDPEMVLVGAFNKRQISGFSGIATLFKNAPEGQATIIGAADLYVSDFGQHRIVPSRFSRDRTANVLDLNFWSVAYLRNIARNPLAVTGDSSKEFILGEYTLVSKNEGASGKVADLTTS